MHVRFHRSSHHSRIWRYYRRPRNPHTTSIVPHFPPDRHHRWSATFLDAAFDALWLSTHFHLVPIGSLVSNIACAKTTTCASMATCRAFTSFFMTVMVTFGVPLALFILVLSPTMLVDMDSFGYWLWKVHPFHNGAPRLFHVNREVCTPFKDIPRATRPDQWCSACTLHIFRPQNPLQPTPPNLERTPQLQGTLPQVPPHRPNMHHSFRIYLTPPHSQVSL
jgi:hypothetical protein